MRRGRASIGVGILLCAWVAGAPATSQSDIDALMKRVLATRDENWKKLQQYLLEEHVTSEVQNGSARIWGERREFQWFLRDGYFIRSPLKINGMTVSDADRRAEEERYFQRAKARDEPAPPGDGKSSLVFGPSGFKFTPARRAVRRTPARRTCRA